MFCPQGGSPAAAVRSRLPNSLLTPHLLPWQTLEVVACSGRATGTTPLVQAVRGALSAGNLKAAQKPTTKGPAFHYHHQPEIRNKDSDKIILPALFFWLDSKQPLWFLLRQIIYCSPN